MDLYWKGVKRSEIILFQSTNRNYMMIPDAIIEMSGVRLEI